MENKEFEGAAQNYDSDATSITGEGMSISAFVEQQKAEKAKQQKAAQPGEKATVTDKSQKPGQQITEEKATAEEGKSQESEKQIAEEKATAESTSQESATPEITLEQVKEILGESNLDALKNWKHSHETREKWNATLSKRAETIPLLQKITEEQWDALVPKLMPYVYGKESIPETPEEFLDQTLESLNGAIPENITVKFHDETYNEDRTMEVNQEVYKPHFKKFAGELIKKALPELPVLREKVRTMEETNKTLQSSMDELSRINGYLVLSSFFANHPDEAPSRISDTESPVDALFRVGESGEDHPEFPKVRRFRAAAQLSKDDGIEFDKAFDQLYGVDKRKIQREEANKKKILESQQKEAGEKGGQEAQPDPLEKQKKRLPKTYEDLVEEMFSNPQ